MKSFRDLYKSKNKKSKKSTFSNEQIINQAIQFHIQGNIQEAAKLYKQLINQGCNDHRVFSNYGGLLQGKGKLQEAEKWYRKTIQFNPDYAIAHCNLGGILKHFGNLKEAEISVRKAIKLNPNLADAYSHLGVILHDLGNLKEAEFSIRKAIELNPDLAEAHNNLGNLLRDIGNLKKAEISVRKAIELNPDLAEAHNNLGILLNDLGNLDEAVISTRKAIELNPDLAELHNNLGNLLRDIGNFREAEISLRKAIELNPDLAKAFYSLSLIKQSDEDKSWQDKLFCENILINKSKKDLVNVYFARANILHKEKQYEESCQFLKLANELKLDIKPSEPNKLFRKSQSLLIDCNQIEINKEECRNYPESIFIVGMPRCGSTLLESILSMSDDVYDLGEINILEDSFLEFKKCNQDINLAEIYKAKVHNMTKLNITTNKWLYNYQYAGIIARTIPNAKIIHCYRHPLDNILSIYRANFTNGNEYSSSLSDSAKIYLHKDNIMTKYKNKFPSKIYDLNYDHLVIRPIQEIKSLISWLGWQWDNKYLSPHLNPRSVSTASAVQVRSPINTKSIGGWKNYKKMLKPAIEILTKKDKYKEITS